MKKTEMSLIIPAYNEEKLLYRTLTSIMKAIRYFELETNKSIEVIVVNNGSTDRTVEIASRFGVTIVHEERRLISAVRNSGVKAAKSDILCFVDADSEVSENIFFLIYNSMISGEYVGGGTKLKLDHSGILFKAISFATHLISYLTGVSAVLIYTSRDVYERIGGFDEKYYAGEDLKFVLQMKKESIKSKKKFKNIYNGYVITSARKFEVMTLTDILLYARMIINNKLMTQKDLCAPWYDERKRGK